MFPPIQHARVSPSRLQRILDCPGSFRLTRDMEQKSSSYANEGTMLHKEVEQVLNNVTDHLLWSAYTHKNDELANEQNIAVTDCINYAGQIARTLNSLTYDIELEVSLLQYHTCLIECGGICDLVIQGFTEDFRRIMHVIDWKFGKGVPVYAADNDQVYAYAAGAHTSADEIVIHVVQPRLDSYDQVTLTAQDLRNWLDMRVIPGVQRAYESDAPFNPGQKQCQFCPARNTCRARHNFAQKTAADIFATHLKLPAEVTIEEVAETLKNADAYISYINDLRKYAYGQILAGKEVPGWKLVAGRSNRSWKDPNQAEAWLIQHFDVDEIYVSKLISPPQAEKLRKSMKKDEGFLALVDKKPGSPTLAEVSDKRPPIDIQSAEDKFAPYSEEIDNG